MHTSLTIKNKQLRALTNWLNQAPLAGRQSRIRTRFLRHAQPRITEIEQERIKIAAEHAEKGEDEKPIVDKSEDGQETYRIPVEHQPAFYKALHELYEEDYIIDLTDSTKELLAGIRDILVNTEHTFTGEEAEWYEDITTTLEETNL